MRAAGVSAMNERGSGPDERPVEHGEVFEIRRAGDLARIDALAREPLAVVGNRARRVGDDGADAPVAQRIQFAARQKRDAALRPQVGGDHDVTRELLPGSGDHAALWRSPVRVGREPNTARGSGGARGRQPRRHNSLKSS